MNRVAWLLMLFGFLTPNFTSIRFIDPHTDEQVGEISIKYPDLAVVSTRGGSLLLSGSGIDLDPRDGQVRTNDLTFPFFAEELRFQNAFVDSQGHAWIEVSVGGRRGLVRVHLDE